MEVWFLKAVIAAISVTPIFIAIAFFKTRYAVDPLVFTAWYLIGAAAGNAALVAADAGSSALVPALPVLVTIVGIGVVFGTLANGLLAQAVTLAPNPGLPPVIYACASLMVFVLSALLASSLPQVFKPVAVEPGRLAGIALILAGLYLLAGSRHVQGQT